jgi:hypothetical protein
VFLQTFCCSRVTWSVARSAVSWSGSSSHSGTSLVLPWLGWLHCCSLVQAWCRVRSSSAGGESSLRVSSFRSLPVVATLLLYFERRFFEVPGFESDLFSDAYTLCMAPLWLEAPRCRATCCTCSSCSSGIWVNLRCSVGMKSLFPRLISGLQAYQRCSRIGHYTIKKKHWFTLRSWSFNVPNAEITSWAYGVR